MRCGGQLYLAAAMHPTRRNTREIEKPIEYVEQESCQAFDSPRIARKRDDQHRAKGHPH